MNLPIVKPFHPKLGLFAADFNRALQTGRVTNGSEHVLAFEDALTRVLGMPTICFNNGMSVLIAMLMACGVKGKEVICPSFTFAATPHAIVMAGATPVFADINPETLCLDPRDVERKITARTVAVLGVDPYGICWIPTRYDWPALKILIDAAPSFGSQCDERRFHSCIYSFHATKPFSTMEGGALCSRDEGLIERARAIRNFGQGLDGDCAEVGFNGKMPEVCALVGLRNLETWKYRSTLRVESASRLRRALAGIEGLRVCRAPAGQSPIWTYQPAFVEPAFGKSRDQVVVGLRERGIGVRVYYTACHLMSVYWPQQHWPNFHADTDPRYKADLPVTERLASQVIALPVYDAMTDAEIEQIATAIKEIQCAS